MFSNIVQNNVVTNTSFEEFANYIYDNQDKNNILKVLRKIKSSELDSFYASLNTDKLSTDSNRTIQKAISVMKSPSVDIQIVGRTPKE